MGLIRLAVLAVLVLMVLRLLQTTGILKPPVPPRQGPERGDFQDLSKD